jgi:coenzyme PQQ precursor peptide PqqA
MSWKAPQIVEMSVGMEINMYACAARGLGSSVGTQPRERPVIA